MSADAAWVVEVKTPVQVQGRRSRARTTSVWRVGSEGRSFAIGRGEG